MRTSPTIFDRAVQQWEGLDWACIWPVLGGNRAYDITIRLADDHAGEFDSQLLDLLASPNPVVVAHALTVLQRSKSPALARIPPELLNDTRTVTIASCLLDERTIGQLATEAVEAVDTNDN